MDKPLFTALLAIGLAVGTVTAENPRRPNVLFISVDDLNDWIGCLEGHPQTITPNFDRLATSGVLFDNAHCAAPACNPSRTAVMTGISPATSGLYENGQKMREVLPDAKLLPQHFRDQGYWAGGSGKMLHYFIDAASWDEYYPEAKKENPFPRTLYPESRPMNLPVGGPWQYGETDWGALEATDEEFGGDWLVAEWIGKQLSRPSEKPLFLACGIYRPHEPWFVPAKYFEPFPLDEIALPPGYKADDLDDLPPAGKRRGPNRYFAHIEKHDQWKQAVQGYLASIHFADAMLGRVLDSLEAGAHADSTIVVLWSDHGWHLGEKQHWQKYTAWRVCTRVPLMFRVPPGISATLPKGTVAGSIREEPVNLLSLAPTLLDLCSLPAQEEHDGPSLRPLLEDDQPKTWPHVSVTHLSQPEHYGLSAREWRYIHYHNGDEELYHVARDPYEWNNLAAHPEYAARLAEMRALAPTEFAPRVEPSVKSLPKLRWTKAAEGQSFPPSKPDGNSFDVVILNERPKVVELSWVDPKGRLKPYGEIAPGKSRSQQTRPGAVWAITDAGSGKALGHFVVGDRKARAVVPSGR